MAEDTGNGDAIDIDVDDDVKEVEIWCDLVMPDSKKSFPNVESLVIKSNVFEIRIPNSLFPNVKKVESYSNYFETHECLIKNDYNKGKTLLNTFCKKEDDFL